MMKKFICVGILLFLFKGNCLSAKASEDDSRATGQTTIIYIADKRQPVEEVDKGEGHLSQGPDTGDITVTDILEILVIASALTLVLIIYIKKGETDYEEN